jgi:2-polyprenyl-3-methyl-5-hydroxy-6-metoxy-1,4-benzoquinol methylase
VKAVIAQRLIDLNKEFYQSAALSFSATRGRLQPGVQRILDTVPRDANVLDLGCGNGGVAAELAQRGHHGRYVGMDFSAKLLEEAKKKVPNTVSNIEFVEADLTGEFDQQSAIKDRRFDWIFAFAVLHHIPSTELRVEFLARVKELLAPDGRFAISTWQFLNSPRLKDRIQSWSAVDLQETAVDAGDYLLDWRSGEPGLRYVHAFSEDELASLAQHTRFKLLETFFSDGENGKLGLYEIWLK